MTDCYTVLACWLHDFHWGIEMASRWPVFPIVWYRFGTPHLHWIVGKLQCIMGYHGPLIFYRLSKVSRGQSQSLLSATSTHFKWELMLYCLHCPTLNKVFLLLLLLLLLQPQPHANWCLTWWLCKETVKESSLMMRASVPTNDLFNATLAWKEFRPSQACGRLIYRYVKSYIDVNSLQREMLWGCD